MSKLIDLGNAMEETKFITKQPVGPADGQFEDGSVTLYNPPE